jgi:hypothetical protein
MSLTARDIQCKDRCVEKNERGEALAQTRLLAMEVGKQKTPRESRGPRRWLLGLSLIVPVYYRAGIATLRATQVGERFVGPEPSALLSISVLAIVPKSVEESNLKT